MMTEALTNYQLDHILRGSKVTHTKYIGSFPSCFKIKSDKKFYAFISNTDEHDEHGEHWCAWVVKGDGICFFDSFGRSPDDKTLPSHFKDFLSEFKSIRYTSKRVQGWKSKACGLFCIHFIYVLCLGLKYEDFLNEYTTNHSRNDSIVIDFVDSII